MKKWLLLLLCCTLLLSASGVFAEAVTPVAEATPVPEGMVVPTRTPLGWLQIGEFGMDADDLTTQERNALIATLQESNVRNAGAAIPVVRGLSTSREEPCYMGQQAQFNQQVPANLNSVEACKVYMQMTDVLRGAQALAAVQALNPLNPAPADGKSYVMATFAIGMTCEDPSLAIPFTTYYFSATTEEGATLAYSTGVSDPQSSIELYSGAISEMHVIFEVDDPAAELLFTYRDAVWFSTRQADAA